MIKWKYLIRLYTNLIKFAFKRCLLFHIIGDTSRLLILKHLGQWEPEKNFLDRN